MEATCTECAGCPFKGVKVGGRGNPQSPIVLVGEGPGYEEIKEGKPFVGPAGQLLSKCLPSGYNLDDFYVINATQCLPRNKTPQKMQEAVKSCQSRLWKEISAHPREMIITLGGSALSAMTNNFSLKITQVRGRKFPCTFSTKGLMATIHPAFILRGGGNIKHLKTDIENALQEVKRTLGEKKYIEPSYEIVSSSPGARNLTRMILEQKDKIIGADIETTGFSQFKNKIITIGIGWEPNKVYIVEAPYIEELKEALESTEVKWLWHNGKFDIKFLRQIGIRARVDHDSMLANYTLDETSNANDLGSVAISLLGCDDWKAELDSKLPSKKASYDMLPKEVLYSYQAKDISYMLQAFAILQPKIDQDAANSKLYYKTLIPASELLSHVERRGMFVDMEWVNKIEQELVQEIDQLSKEINALVGYSINPNSSQQVCAYVYDKLGIKAKERSTDAKIVANWPDIPFKILLKKYRVATKALSTYVRGYPSLREEFDCSVHCTFKLHRTPTGRLACGEPNLQNIPRDPKMKGMYKAREGYVFVEMDYSQAELRSLAVQSQDPELLRIFNTPGLSIHKEMAIARYGDGYTETQYVRAKAVNFGIVYGRTAFSIADEFGTSISEASSIIDTWFLRFPVAKQYIDKCRGTVAKGQLMCTTFGRKKRPKYPSFENLKALQNEAANFPHQSVASDCTLHSAIALYKELQEKWGAYIVDIVHDSIIIECPNRAEVISAVKKYASDVMEQIPKSWGIVGVPFLTDAKISINWGNKI